MDQLEPIAEDNNARENGDDHDGRASPLNFSAYPDANQQTPLYP